MSVVHTIMTPTVYSGRLIYDEDVEIGEGARVLDAGVGSGKKFNISHYARLFISGSVTVGCWLLDLAKKVPDSVELHGVDVYGGNFPKVYPPSVHLEVNSVTKLPEEWSERFDFVNERLHTWGRNTTRRMAHSTVRAIQSLEAGWFYSTR